MGHPDLSNIAFVAMFGDEEYNEKSSLNDAIVYFPQFENPKRN